jgi:Fuc2NAc and GlcNAc transferase
MDLLLAFGASLLLTIFAHRYAISRGVLDVPNSRSSHMQPTPRGGGISFVITYSVYLVLSCLRNTVDRNVAVALVGGGLMTALVGWVDDHRGLSPKLRLAVHLAAAAWAVGWIRPGQLDLGIFEIRGTILVSCFGLLMVTWFTNLFNFMDGIDGIASVEAITCGLGAWMMARRSDGSAVASFVLVLASSVLGFLPMNWSPAKIFMGDVGSGYLGFTLGALTVASERLGGTPAWTWLVLLGVFVTDATLTLARRILRGEVWYEAHRTHVYQLAVQVGYSHRQVTLTVLVTTLCIWGVCFVTYGRWSGGAITVAAYALLVTAHILLYYSLWKRSTNVPSRSVPRSLHHSG